MRGSWLTGGKEYVSVVGVRLDRDSLTVYLVQFFRLGVVGSKSWYFKGHAGEMPLVAQSPVPQPK